MRCRSIHSADSAVLFWVHGAQQLDDPVAEPVVLTALLAEVVEQADSQVL
jgi:hypothetical protein